MLTLFAETLKQNYTTEALTYLIVESPGMCTLVRGVSVLVYVYVCLCVCVCVHRLCVSYVFFMYTSIIHIYKTENLCIQYLLFMSIHMCTCVYIHIHTSICWELRCNTKSGHGHPSSTTQVLTNILYATYVSCTYQKITHTNKFHAHFCIYMYTCACVRECSYMRACVCTCASMTCVSIHVYNT